MATGRLFLWSEVRGEWVSCPPDEITWLDRRLLSGNEDLTLHRAPRCAGVRYVHHRWELFSRDTTYRVYLVPEAAGRPLTLRPCSGWRARCCPLHRHATKRFQWSSQRDRGWSASAPGCCGCGSTAARPPSWPPRTVTSNRRPGRKITRRGSVPEEDAVSRVLGYFMRNATARLTMAYYYQEFILGRPPRRRYR